MTLQVLLVTSWNTPCGIADHSAMLQQSVEAAAAGAIQVVPSAAALDPVEALNQLDSMLTENRKLVLHLNHHDALHSRWTPEMVQQVKTMGIPVVVTYHDTRADENSAKAHQLHQVADAFVVHEPVADLPKALYWRQGIPAPAQTPYWYYSRTDQTSMDASMRRIAFKAFPQQPVLGTVGFNFPWKNYDRLCQLTAELGWALVLLSNNATAADIMRWEAMNPNILVVPGFLPSSEVVNYLVQCDATAFMYECSNTGTSGAIRQGIAARKPVVALQTCRQFRDLRLLDDPNGNWPTHLMGRSMPGLRTGVRWVSDWTFAGYALQEIPRMPYDPRVAEFAHQDRWEGVGQRYARLYQGLVEG